VGHESRRSRHKQQKNSPEQERVLDDIRDARHYGAQVIFLIDDNITLNVRRFEELCRAIIAAGLNEIDYTVQSMTSSMANHGETLAPLMRQAGFRYIFLGIENILYDGGPLSIGFSTKYYGM
jgi:anaerobic magnesium-protoporphyrin IX monomethyl ester cyclase